MKNDVRWSRKGKEVDAYNRNECIYKEPRVGVKGSRKGKEVDARKKKTGRSFTHTIHTGTSPAACDTRARVSSMLDGPMPPEIGKFRVKANLG